MQKIKKFLQVVLEKNSGQMNKQTDGWMVFHDFHCLGSKIMGSHRGTLLKYTLMRHF